MDIVATRLQNQHLAGTTLASAQDVVAHLGAVQAQEYAAAKWALALRLKNATSAQLDEAFNNGEILRTHVMRPTWHFVTPRDIVWMLQLTAPRVEKIMGYYNHKLDLDRKLFNTTNSIIGDALAGKNFLTRQQISEVLQAKGINATGQRLGHIMMQAELDAVVCSGPLSGKQFTYALLSERAPHAKKQSREESLAMLAERYFTSHGPATVHDFAWWSGLTVTDAKLGIQLSKRLVSQTVNDNEYWFGENAKPAAHIPKMMLLSIYDEYTIAYNDYSPVFPLHAKKLTTLVGNAWLNYVVVQDGRVIGTFRRQALPKEIKLEMRLLVTVTSADKKLIAAAATQYGEFFNLPVTVSYAT